jgi:spoIIIJ-associated protein
MKSLESSAKTIEEAVSQGLEKLGVSLGDVSIDILDEGSKGLFGLLGGKPARVRLTVKDNDEESDLLSTLSLQYDTEEPEYETGKPAKAAAKTEKAIASKSEADRKPVKAVNVADKKPAKAENTAEKKTDRFAAEKAKPTAEPASAGDIEMCDPETPEGKAQRFLIDVTRMMSVDVTVAAKRDEEGNVRVDMQGDTLGILIGRRGETLDALQYLTSLNVNRGKEEYTRVTIDTENYRAKREEALTRLANRMANRAVKTGRKVVLEPMNPYERRILHSALQANEAVSTHSEGDEPNRHVVITLK